jgi:anti-sigma factor RsiW
MECRETRDALDRFINAELTPMEHAHVADHLAECEACQRERDVLDTLRTQLRENLVRYTAPDALRSRMHAQIVLYDAAASSVLRRPWRRWPMAIAAGLLIAVASSGVTLAVARRYVVPPVANELVASHIRSLMPGHLTDVVSSNQHNVKPWFNGRVDMSPTVPDLSANGFPLVGGRLDYVNGRAVPVIVYSRRSHLINVYEWPESAATHFEPRNVNGYHLVEWYRSGIEYWAVSDLNDEELNAFVRAFGD